VTEPPIIGSLAKLRGGVRQDTKFDNGTLRTYKTGMGPDNNKTPKRVSLTALPSTPDTLLRLLGSLSRENPDFTELGRIMRHDPALCARVLDVTYPAYSIAPRRLLSLEQVLADLGVDALKTMVFSTAVNQVFHHPSAPAENLLAQESGRWIYRAYLARGIAEHIGYTSPDEAYLTGLLFDIGKFALAANFPMGREGLFLNVQNSDTAILSEGISADLNRATGVDLVSDWAITSFMADAIRYRDEPTDRILSAPVLLKILHLANLVAEGADYSRALPFQSAERLFGFKPSEFEQLVRDTQVRVSEAVRSLSIVKGRATLDSAAFDKVKRVRLAREVREIGLLSRMRPNFSGLRDEVDIFAAIRRTLHVLFDFPRHIFFRYDAKTNELVGTALSGQNEIINQLRVPFAPGASLLVDAVLRNEPLNSFDPEHAAKQMVVDEQIIRLTGQEGILCLPLAGKGNAIGVIALGLAEDQIVRLEPQIRLLSKLTSQAGLALDFVRRKLPTTQVAGEGEGLTVSLAELRRIVHEVSNPLTIMKNYTKILRLKLPEDDPAQRDLNVIDDEIDRVGAVLKNLVEPGVGRAPFVPELVDVNTVLFDLTRLTDGSLLLQRNVRLRTELTHAIPPVVADRDRLKQIMVNLINNAAEAMPSGGTITLSTRNGIVFEGREFVEISVHDDGPGIPESVKARIFQPGVSTKSGDHAGLGLSIVYHLIQEIRGQIRWSSDPEHGTTFQIWLPKTRG
jgi:signal transduction histidine kinase/HD-like signal output (HDOD) protein